MDEIEINAEEEQKAQNEYVKPEKSYSDLAQQTKDFMNYRFKNGLSRRQVMFCQKYLENGHNICKAAMAAGYGGFNPKAAFCAGWGLLKKTRIKWYINKRVKSVERKLQVGFEEKYKKLWQVATVSTPDDAKTKSEIDGKTTVSAIGEMNKMVGDIAPEKRVNLNLDTDADIKKIKQVQEKLLEKHNKEY